MTNHAGRIVGVLACALMVIVILRLIDENDLDVAPADVPAGAPLPQGPAALEPASVPAPIAKPSDAAAGEGYERAAATLLQSAEADFGNLDAETKHLLDQGFLSSLRSYEDRFKAMESSIAVKGEKTLADAIQEMTTLHFMKQKEVARMLLASGEYRVFAAGTEQVHEARIKPNHTPLTVYNARRSDGRDMDVLFEIPNDHPLLAGLAAELKLLRNVKKGLDADFFNDLPLDERRKRIAAHRAAIEEVRALRMDPTMPADERQRRFADLEKKLLPAGWTIYCDDSVGVAK